MKKFGKVLFVNFLNLATPDISICGECSSLYYCEGCHACAYVEKDNNPNCQWWKQWLKLKG